MTTTAVRRLARSTRLEISTDGTTWLKVPGVVDLAPQVTPTKTDSSDYDSNGWKSSEITLQEWVLTAKYNKLENAGVVDTVQETIRACQGQFGDAARLYVRYYDTDGGAEAKSGRAIVEVQRSKTAVADLAEVTITLTGDGPLTDITNPYAPAAAPVVTSATPTGAGTGAQVQITGQGFTGTTAVKFGATNASSYVLVSDTTIVAVMPSGSAGSAAVTVTNATGASNSFAYTRAA